MEIDLTLHSLRIAEGQGRPAPAVQPKRGHKRFVLFAGAKQGFIDCHIVGAVLQTVFNVTPCVQTGLRDLILTGYFSLL
jgi:hypothetical protein